MTTAMQEKLKSTEISPFIGSKVHLSKDELLSGEFAADLRELLEQRGVLIFPKVGFNDDEQVRFLAESILQEEGHQTLSASTPEQAIALLEAGEHIDLLFTDLELQTELFRMGGNLIIAGSDVTYLTAAARADAKALRAIVPKGV